MLRDYEILNHQFYEPVKFVVVIELLLIDSSSGSLVVFFAISFVVRFAVAAAVVNSSTAKIVFMFSIICCLRSQFVSKTNEFGCNRLGLLTAFVRLKFSKFSTLSKSELTLWQWKIQRIPPWLSRSINSIYSGNLHNCFDYLRTTTTTKKTPLCDLIRISFSWDLCERSKFPSFDSVSILDFPCSFLSHWSRPTHNFPPTSQISIYADTARSSDLKNSTMN